MGTMKDKSIVIIGGGASIKDGIALGLWDKLQQSKLDIASINFAYMAMPFTPTYEVWLDTTFFRNNMDSLFVLEQKGCKMITKVHSKYDNLPTIKKYAITREKPDFSSDTMFVGMNGLSGFFALSIAVKQGYETIYLLGYDFGTNSINNTNTHFYQDTLAVPSSGVRNPGVYLQHQGGVKKEVHGFDYYLSCKPKIFNVSPSSNINTFQKIDYPRLFELIA